ncbi:hypothetical protein [Bdellovibrio sp. HCB2-146]|uniref:hypothetical protein n=1 Tax=Bdellovibrio sp. HCB2-146 TaxID=3394362 RepID=UPI0039BCEDD3
MKLLNRRGFIKSLILPALLAFGKPVLAFSNAHLRRARRVGGTGTLRCAQTVKIVAGLSSQQLLRTSHLIKVVATQNDTQSLRCSHAILIVAVPTP